MKLSKNDDKKDTIFAMPERKEINRTKQNPSIFEM